MNEATRERGDSMSMTMNFKAVAMKALLGLVDDDNDSSSSEADKNKPKKPVSPIRRRAAVAAASKRKPVDESDDDDDVGDTRPTHDDSEEEFGSSKSRRSRKRPRTSSSTSRHRAQDSSKKKHPSPQIAASTAASTAVGIDTKVLTKEERRENKRLRDNASKRMKRAAEKERLEKERQDKAAREVEHARTKPDASVAQATDVTSATESQDNPSSTQSSSHRSHGHDDVKQDKTTHDDTRHKKQPRVDSTDTADDGRPPSKPSNGHLPGEERRRHGASKPRIKTQDKEGDDMLDGSRREDDRRRRRGVSAVQEDAAPSMPHGPAPPSRRRRPSVEVDALSVILPPPLPAPGHGDTAAELSIRPLSTRPPPVASPPAAAIVRTLEHPLDKTHEPSTEAVVVPVEKSNGLMSIPSSTNGETLQAASDSMHRNRLPDPAAAASDTNIHVDFGSPHHKHEEGEVSEAKPSSADDAAADNPAGSSCPSPTLPSVAVPDGVPPAEDFVIPKKEKVVAAAVPAGIVDAQDDLPIPRRGSTPPPSRVRRPSPPPVSSSYPRHASSHNYGSSRGTQPSTIGHQPNVVTYTAPPASSPTFRDLLHFDYPVTDIKFHQKVTQYGSIARCLPPTFTSSSARSQRPPTKYGVLLPPSSSSSAPSVYEEPRAFGRGKGSHRTLGDGPAFFGIDATCPAALRPDRAAHARQVAVEADVADTVLNTLTPWTRSWVQRHLYSTTFQPLSARHRITVLFRHMRYTHPSGGIMFNTTGVCHAYAKTLAVRFAVGPDRDSPGIDIPPDSWKVLQKSRSSFVYAKYYSMEDAQMAVDTHVDDDGRPGVIVQDAYFVLPPSPPLPPPPTTTDGQHEPRRREVSPPPVPETRGLPISSNTPPLQLQPPLPPPDDETRRRMALVHPPLPPPDDETRRRMALVHPPLPPPGDEARRRMALVHPPLPPPDDDWQRRMDASRWSDSSRKEPTTTGWGGGGAPASRHEPTTAPPPLPSDTQGPPPPPSSSSSTLPQHYSRHDGDGSGKKEEDAVKSQVDYRRNRRESMEEGEVAAPTRKPQQVLPSTREHDDASDGAGVGDALSSSAPPPAAAEATAREQDRPPPPISSADGGRDRSRGRRTTSPPPLPRSSTSTGLDQPTKTRHVSPDRRRSSWSSERSANSTRPAKDSRQPRRSAERGRRSPDPRRPRRSRSRDRPPRVVMVTCPGMKRDDGLVRAFFRDCGQVDNVEWRSGPPDYAYVTFHSATAAAAALRHKDRALLGATPARVELPRRLSTPHASSTHSIIMPPPMSPPPGSPRTNSPREVTVVVCINVLPLVFTRASLTESCPWHVEWSTSSYGLFLRNIVSGQRFKPMFIGCPEVFIPKQDEQSVRLLLLHSFNCIPVFLDTTVAHRHFQGFCKGVLWPIFHNVVDVYNSAELKLDDFDTTSSSSSTLASSPPPDPGVWLPPASWNPASQDKCWSEYCHVNRLFAKKVLENWQPGSVIWIHDYPLLVLASYLLRKLRGGGALALFMHVPFPSSEIFRTLTVRTELLRAMLCANHIGFLVFEHARHFLTACKRLLGLNYRTSHTGMLAVEYNGRLVLVTCSHCGTELHHMRALLGKLDSDPRAVALQATLAPLVHKFIFASVDRLEGLCGVPLKLRAFDRFLHMYPHRRTDTVLVQFGISLDCRPNDYHRTQQYVEKFVAELNRRWGTPTHPVVVYEERAHMQAQERMALWHVGHVFLDTCVRGGLSMLPFEFLAAHHGGDRPGVLVASEFACYSRILNGALLVNPWKADDVVAALVKAVEMPPYEMKSRFALNFKFLLDNPVSEWGARMLADIQKAGVPTTSVPPPPHPTAATSSRGGGGCDCVEVGFGFDYRVVQFSPGFAALDVDDTVKKYATTSRRLLVFDYGGTLSWTLCLMDDEASMYYYYRNPDDKEGSAADEMDPAARLASVRKRDGQVRTPVSVETKASLELLCNDPCNVVVVWSNGRRVELDHEFGSIAGLHLISDSGYFLRKSDSVVWESLYADAPDDFAWKPQVANVVRTYVGRTNGAFAIVNETSVTFDYHNSDPEYGEMQAAELYEHLSQLLKKDKVAIARGKGFVEVHRFGVNKAIAISMVLTFCKDKAGASPDMILCVGDDESDEPAFKTFADAEKVPHVLTCTVGKKPSTAQFYVVPSTSHDPLTNLFLDGGKIICPVFVRNLSKEFSKVISTTNLEEFCVDRFNPAMLASPRRDGGRLETTSDLGK
ncbi:hypothetical protein DYB37_002478 [Aphanomyces astaci]|uniref:Uncharacterized protein n=1 Tax=Aphanomyces astaci TaxID=112090 RepID=A0A3R7BV68_APHAT|nr:hypothetical protein DYB35_001076 [Aphanomyces astaci]RHZ24406.1 hypothetical protein DYB37_002478 [Aphanomyces astaci]